MINFAVNIDSALVIRAGTHQGHPYTTKTMRTVLNAAINAINIVKINVIVNI